MYYRILLCWSLAIERENTWRIRRWEEEKAEDGGCALVDLMGCLRLFVSSPPFSPPLSLPPPFILPPLPSIENGFFLIWYILIVVSLPPTPNSSPPPLLCRSTPFLLSHYNINRLLRDNIYLFVCPSIYLSTYLSIKTLYYQNRTKQNKQTERNEHRKQIQIQRLAHWHIQESQ